MHNLCEQKMIEINFFFFIKIPFSDLYKQVNLSTLQADADLLGSEKLTMHGSKNQKNGTILKTSLCKILVGLQGAHSL